MNLARKLAAALGWSLVSVSLAILLVALIACLPAFSRNLGQWDNADPDLKSWYESLRQPDNPGVSCCGEADAYYADSYEVQGDQYVAIITDERVVEGRVPRAVGTRVLVPRGKITFKQGNPTGHGIIFISPYSEELTVYCFLSPGGG